MLGERNVTAIEDDALVWRRIQSHHVAKTDDSRRLASNFAQPSSMDGALSASLGSDAIVASGERALELHLKAFPDCGMAEVSAGDLRELGYTLTRDPTMEDPHHVLIHGAFSQSKRRKLAKTFTVVKWPPGPA